MQKLLFIFEFGVPNYRGFILDYFQRAKKYNVSTISADDKFDYQKQSSSNVIARHIVGKEESRFYLFNPLRVLTANYIVTTFNLRRPHTWIFVLIFPWKKWIFWGQGIWSNEGSVNLLRKLLLKLSSGYIVYTQEGKANLVKFGYESSKISVAQNTLFIGNSEKISNGSYLLYVGRIQERKGLELLFPHLRKLGLMFLIVGDGTFKKKLQILVKNYNISDLVLFEPGTFDDNKIKEYFRGALCYASPGHVGLGVVHAFSYGCPVLTLKDRTHAPEYAYCNNNNSFLIENTSDLSSSLTELIECHDNLVDKRRAAYSTYIAELSPKNVISAFEYHLDDN